MLRVVLYSPTSRSESGGVQAVISHLGSALRRNGHEVTECWASGGPAQSPDEWILPLPADTTKGHFPSPRSALRGAVSLAGLAGGLAKRRPGIVNIHFLRGQTAYFLALKRALGFKVVLSAHGSDILKPPASCSRYLPHFCRFADAVTVVSENLAEAVRGYPQVDPAKIRVIPNGIDYDFWASDQLRARDADDPAPTIVAAGRAEHVKGFDVLIRGFACLRATFPAARLVIAGDGALRSELKEQADSLGMGEAVDLPGHLDRSALRNLFSAASAFVLSSWSEGMPLALLEAMASGAPVVATRVGGVPEVLTPGAGLMVDRGDSAAIANALARILGDKTLAQDLARAGRKRASEFSNAKSDQAYEDLYQGLLGR